MNNGLVPSSYKDPSGFLFYREGRLYRQINLCYQEDYQVLVNSGLYDRLVTAELLIPHVEVDIFPEDPSKAFKIILPDRIHFISYPYEWCFSQLKDAALTTLKIQKIALEFGMSLKDASAFNIQFHRGKPILIDTLSFEKYCPGQPWVAYQQFCSHFLAPLLLMKYIDIRLNKLMIPFINGIPLDLASSMLQKYSFFRLGTFLHIYLQGKIEKYLINKQAKNQEHKLKQKSLFKIIDNLISYTKKLKLKLTKTEWGDYYENNIYTEKGFINKKNILSDFLKKTKSTSVWDLGGNDGSLSRIASKMGIFTICLDIDPLAIEKNYCECKINSEDNLLPLIIDIANPTPSIGWDNQERMSILERGPTDTVIALALIHHLAFTYNLPFLMQAELFNKLCKYLIIEFVPKNDPQVIRMLKNREDIFSDYSYEVFENVFKNYFILIDYAKIDESDRTIYLFKNKNRIDKD